MTFSNETPAEYLANAAEHYARRGEWDEALRLIRLALGVLTAEDRVRIEELFR